MARPGSTPPRRGWHRLIEHYTPDGALGRLLLAGAAGTVSLFSFWVAVVGITAVGLLSLLVGLLALGVTFGTALLTAVTLWPVYLSLIGNVPSAADYPDGDPAAAEPADADPIATLQHRYATGDLSREEFDRRLDDLLHVEAQLPAGDAAPDGAERSTLRETADR